MGLHWKPECLIRCAFDHLIRLQISLDETCQGRMSSTFDHHDDLIVNFFVLKKTFTQTGYSKKISYLRRPQLYRRRRKKGEGGGWGESRIADC